MTTPSYNIPSNISNTSATLNDPDTSHIYTAPYHNAVYQPTDDTWLMMDALIEEKQWILQRLNIYHHDTTTVTPTSSSTSASTSTLHQSSHTHTHTHTYYPSCLEIGSGSGILLTHLYMNVLNRIAGIYLAIDKNPLACQCTQLTFQRNGLLYGDVVNADIVTCLLRGYNNSHHHHHDDDHVVHDNHISNEYKQSNGIAVNKYDIILFNPPYVLTDDSDASLHGDTSIHISYAGGTRGRYVTDRLLPYISDLLSARGILYMVLVEENDPSDIMNIMKGYGLHSECVKSKRAKNERLQIWKYYRIR
jgi:release factor glutamine methyltransferase